MAYDGQVIRRARQRLDRERQDREDQLENRRREIYARLPRVEEIDRELRRTMARLLSAAMRRGEDPGPVLRDLEQGNLALQKERAELLMKHGYPANCLEDRPACEMCGDTGYMEGGMCDCLRELCRQEQIKALSDLLELGDQNFEGFRLDVYDDEPWPGQVKTPRENMRQVLQICTGYAEKFGRYGIDNLFLSGDPGLGKTFLSACIARRVSELGFSVVYDTAVNVFAGFEAKKFAHGEEESRQAEDQVRRYLVCDLLILDDLGTELTTPFVQSALYQLINARLTAGKRTIVNSNLSPEELKRRYSAPAVSRLLGEYRCLSFYGTDLRQK